MSWIPYAGLIVFLLLGIALPNLVEPVIRDDPGRNISIPPRLLHPMLVKAAFNEQTMHFRFDLPAPEPSWYHDVLVYRGEGRWEVEGYSPVGRQRHRLYEDRISFFVDDGRVPEFGKWGGFVTVSGEEMRFFTAAAREEVRAHPRFGPQGRSDLRKWLPETRTDPSDWRTVRSDEELAELQRAGYFLDLWHWRAHRSSPVGWADDEYVIDYRYGDPGRSMFRFNWDEQEKRPLYMFDPATPGGPALRFEDLAAQRISQHEGRRYALIAGGGGIEGNAVPFDPDRAWVAGDALPRRVLQRPDGPRSSIRSRASYSGGRWQVDLMRALDTGEPLYDKALAQGGLYQVAFAAHLDATGSRWHYVSFPKTLGLGRDADIKARRFAGENPPWDEIPWYELILFYPGQIHWAHLTGPGHAGSHDMARGMPLAVGHDEETLAWYALQYDFRDEITSQWIQTTAAMAAMIVLMSLGVFSLTGRRRKLPANEAHGGQAP